MIGCTRHINERDKLINSEEYDAIGSATSSMKKNCTDYLNILRNSNIFTDIDVDADDWTEDFLDAEQLRNIDLHTKLNGIARQQYFRYLEKCLLKNHEINQCLIKCVDQLDIQLLAACLERRAVRQCMLFGVYQSFMLNIISRVRDATENGEFYVSKELWMKVNKVKERISREQCKIKTHSVQTQTEDLSDGECQCKESAANSEQMSLSLDRKIRLFKRKLNENDRNQDSGNGPKHLKLTNCQNIQHSMELSNCITAITPNTPTEMKSPFHPADHANNQFKKDEIDEALSELFGDDKNNSANENDIFNDSRNTQIHAILSEIDRFHPKSAATYCSASESSFQTQNNWNLTPSPTLTIDSSFEILSKSPSKKLKHISWPCEYYMQRSRLRDRMTMIAERNLRQYERIKAKFRDLFGVSNEYNYDENYDEDFEGPFSPPIELSDPVLFSSCQRRIAPWIVSYLMRPMQHGLIANRSLFKKLAKHLTKSLIFINQYPDQGDVKNMVNDFFRRHPKVNSIKDIF